jgi:hypothetical protein
MRIWTDATARFKFRPPREAGVDPGERAETNRAPIGVVVPLWYRMHRAIRPEWPPPGTPGTPGTPPGERYWDTSDSNPNGGPGWIPQDAFFAIHLAGFQLRHPPGL